jgi:hypothetical protein
MVRGMIVTICRWPLKEVTKDKRYIRTQEPTGLLECFADEKSIVRGVVHLKFPGLMGWYDFRLSTGRCTLESMKDYVLHKDSLSALRLKRDRAKEERAKELAKA